MTQEEKQLLLKDLCGRLPYGVKVKIRNDYTFTMEDMEFKVYHLTTASYNFECRGLRPYLRPLSSMTEEEKEELSHCENSVQRTDFFYAHHIDCRFLIEKGLALEAPKDMYKTE